MREDNFKTDRARKGGIASAEALTSDEKKARASNAALARWSPDLPQTEFEGKIKIGGAEISAAVLPNGKRLLSQGTFLQAIGRSRTPKAGTGGLTVDGLPSFLTSEALKPFISDELKMSTTPIYFKSKNGVRTVGYDANLLPLVCEVYLKLRDSCLREGKAVPAQSRHIIEACDVLDRGLKRVGIAALVDEATGFQDKRAKDAMTQILEAFIAKELQPYVKTFPLDYYKEIYRLKTWEFPPKASKHNSNLGKITNDLVYARLAPGVREELHKLTPRYESGRLKNKLFQRLETFGSVKLKEHLAALVMALKLSESWDGFKKSVDRVLPRYDLKDEPKVWETKD